jgi:phospho-N-acetylmuramoyl-pentapeptide-transferase
VFIIYYGIGALIVSLVIGTPVIKILKKVKAGATIQEELAYEQQVKMGTPLMGGFIFIIPIVVMLLGFLLLNQSYFVEVAIILLFVIGYGVIGFIDDYLKVVKKHSDGLKAKQKIILQIGIIVLYYLLVRTVGVDTTIYFPLIDKVVDLKILYLPFLLFFSVGFSNAVNLTDGMDGLLAGVFICTSIAYAVIGNYLSNTLIALLAIITTGSLIGYLKFNYHPAKVFMGDTGSLALGGVIVSYALLTKTEVLLLLLGGLYVIEAISVILQVSYFKITNGKRIFKMAPIHHHFTLAGVKETKVVFGFWLASAVFGVLGVVIMILI